MSKSILVIDTPENCIECRFFAKRLCGNGRCTLNQDISNVIPDRCKSDWCPLRELTKKKDMYFREECSMYISRYWEGYNALIDEILKGENGNEV